MVSCRVQTRGGGCAGCSGNTTAPQQGDIRLTPFPGLNVSTQPCDDVHFGAVEFFNDGQWGRICRSSFNSFASFIVDARVICRQLGFPFSNLMDVEEVRSSSGGRVGSTLDAYADIDYLDLDPAELELVWATELQCTGQEERLSDCFFPEDFGNVIRDFNSALTQPAPESSPPGIQDADCRVRDNYVLGVVCRSFKIEGSTLSRMCWFT